MGENFSDLYLEKAYDWGFIEIALQNPELHKIAMNNYVKQNNYKLLSPSLILLVSYSYSLNICFCRYMQNCV